MRELGLQAVQPRAYKRTTVPAEQPVEAPDLLGRDFDPASSAPGQWLVGSGSRGRRSPRLPRIPA
jgi:putative transposase